MTTTTILAIDGWEFACCDGDIHGHLREFRRAHPTGARAGRCLDCGDHITAGNIILHTPSNKPFATAYRDPCSCRPAGLPAASRTTIDVRWLDAVAVLREYITDKAIEALKAAMAQVYNREPGATAKLEQAWCEIVHQAVR